MEAQINYNDEPVHYCKQCLCLGNPKMLDDIECCDYCGSTEFEDSHIEEWEAKFEKKYRQGKFIKINKKHKKGELWKTIVESPNNMML